MGLLDSLFLDPTAAGGGWLANLLGITPANVTKTPTVGVRNQATGAYTPAALVAQTAMNGGPAPVNPAMSAFSPPQGLLGNSLIANGIRGGLAGLASSNGYKGFGAQLGAGFEGGVQGNLMRQQLNARNALMGQQYQLGTQQMAQNYGQIAMEAARISRMTGQTVTPQDLMNNPQLVSQAYQTPAGQGGAQPAQGGATPSQAPSLQDRIAQYQNDALLYGKDFADTEIGTDMELQQSLAAAKNAPPPGFSRDPATGGLIVDPQWLRAQEAIKAAGKNSVTLNMPPLEATASAEAGKVVGTDVGNVLQAGRVAPSNIAKYTQLGSLLDQVDTGKFKGTVTDLQAAAKSIGIDIGDTSQLGPAQAAQAISNQLALQLRNPASGAGMPGSLSDSDRAFLASMVPNIEKVPGANRLLLDWYTRLEKRNEELSAVARKYMRDHKNNLDAGVYDDFQKYADEHPLFPTIIKGDADYAKLPSGAEYIGPDGIPRRKP